MKRLVTTYTFDASAKTVTLDAVYNLEQILLITNTTRNAIIYNFSDYYAGGVLVGNVLTLEYNTTAMADTDRLQIWVEDTALTPATATNQTNGNQQAKVYLTDELGVQRQMLSDSLFEGAPVVIDSAHHEIHCGDSYVVTEITASTNANNSHYILVTVPAHATKQFHMDIIITSGASTGAGEGVWSLWEAPTVTTPVGATLTPRNRNRYSESDVNFPAELTFLYDPTGVTAGTGTKLFTKRTGSSRTGALGRGGEFVLKNNTRYYIQWTSSAAGAIADFELNYYIHPGI